MEYTIGLTKKTKVVYKGMQFLPHKSIHAFLPIFKFSDYHKEKHKDKDFNVETCYRINQPS